MTYHYIDFENVTYHLADYIHKLNTNQDKFFVFLSVGMAPMKNSHWVRIVEAMNECKYPPEFIMCPQGPESADKFIIAALAVDTTHDNRRTYRVFSGDMGNDAVYNRIGLANHADVRRISMSELGGMEA